MLEHILWTAIGLALWYSFIRLQDYNLHATLALALLSHIFIVVIVAHVPPVDLFYIVLRHTVVLYNNQNMSWPGFAGIALGVFILLVRWSNPEMFEGKAGRWWLFVLPWLFYYPIATVVGLVIAVYDKIIFEACLGEIFWDSTQFAFHLGLALLLPLLIVNSWRSCCVYLQPIHSADRSSPGLGKDGYTTPKVARGPGGFPTDALSRGLGDESDSESKLVRGPTKHQCDLPAAELSPKAAGPSIGLLSPPTSPKLDPSSISAPKSRPAGLWSSNSTTPEPPSTFRPTAPLHSATSEPRLLSEPSRLPMFTIPRPVATPTRKPESLLRNNETPLRKNALNPRESRSSTNIRDNRCGRYELQPPSPPPPPAGKTSLKPAIKTTKSPWEPKWVRGSVTWSDDPPATGAGAKETPGDYLRSNIGSPMKADDYTCCYQKAVSPIVMPSDEWRPVEQPAPEDVGDRLSKINDEATNLSQQLESFRISTNQTCKVALTLLRTRVIAPLEELELDVGPQHDRMHVNLTEWARELQITAESLAYGPEIQVPPESQQRDATRTSDEPWGKAAIRQFKTFADELDVFEAKVAQIESRPNSAMRRSKCEKSVARLELVLVFLRSMQLYGHPGLKLKRESQCKEVIALIDRLKKLLVVPQPDQDPKPGPEDLELVGSSEMDITSPTYLPDNDSPSEPKDDTVELRTATMRQFKLFYDMLNNFGDVLDEAEKEIDQPPTEQAYTEAKRMLKEQVWDWLQDLPPFDDPVLKSMKQELTKMTLHIGAKLDFLAEKARETPKKESNEVDNKDVPLSLDDNKLVQSSHQIHNCVKEVHIISQKWKKPPNKVTAKLQIDVALVCDRIGQISASMEILRNIQDERVLQFPANISEASESMLFEIQARLKNVQEIDERIKSQTISQLNHVSLYLDEVERNVKISRARVAERR